MICLNPLTANFSVQLVLLKEVDMAGSPGGIKLKIGIKKKTNAVTTIRDQKASMKIPASKL